MNRKPCNSWVCATSRVEKFPFSPRKGGIIKDACFCLISPPKTITWSLGSNRSNIPDNAVIALSLMLHVYKELIN